MSDFLAEQQITTLQGYDAEHITRRSRPGRRRQRHLARQRGARGSARSQDPLLLAARGDPRSLPLGRALGRDRRHARQDDDDVADRLAADARRRRSERAHRRHRRQLRRQLPHRRRARVRDRGGRVRQRVLRQDREVPEVPARHRRRQQHRVRPRRHLSRTSTSIRLAFRRFVNLVPRRGLLLVGADDRGGAGAGEEGALPRRDVRAVGGRRLAGARPEGARGLHHLQRAAARRAGRRRSRCRCSAPTTCATRSPRSPSAPPSASAPTRWRPGCARSRACAAGCSCAARRAASRSTTTSRTIRPRSRRRWPASAPPIPTAASGRSSSRAPRPRAARSSRRLRARVRGGRSRPAAGRSSDRRCRRTSGCRPSSSSRT